MTHYRCMTHYRQISPTFERVYFWCLLLKGFSNRPKDGRVFKDFRNFPKSQLCISLYDLLNVPCMTYALACNTFGLYPSNFLFGCYSLVLEHVIEVQTINSTKKNIFGQYFKDKLLSIFFQHRSFIVFSVFRCETILVKISRTKYFYQSFISKSHFSDNTQHQKNNNHELSLT